MKVEKYKIRSSFIGSVVTYVESSKRLGITIGNHIYYYYGVSKNRLTRFLNADSKGRYFGKHIKGQYKSRKVSVL